MGTKVSGFGIESEFGKHVAQTAPYAHRTPEFFHRKGAFIDVSVGAGDEGKPIKLDSSGKIDSSMYVAGGGNVAPVGSIIAWLGGYFTDNGNGGYSFVLGSANSVVGANAYLNALGWYVCDGALLNLVGSPIFDGAGRYLPKLTDDRFIMGNNVGGGSGGDNAMAHTHVVGTYAADNESAHTHGVGTLATGNESAHTHGVGTLATGNESAHTHSDDFSVDNESSHTHSDNLSVNAEASHNHNSGTLGTNTAGAHTHNTQYASGQAGVSRWGVDKDMAARDTYFLACAMIGDGVVAQTGAVSTQHSHSVNSGATGGGSSHSHGISGSVGAGSAHSHGISGSVGAGSAHNHTVTGASGAGAAHNHTVTGASGAGAAHGHSISGSSGAASVTENRPKFLGCFYIMKVI